MEQDNQNKIDKIARDIEIIAQASTFSSSSLFKYFVFGIFYGLGATVGVTILIAILGLLLKFFGGIPVIGNFFIELGTYLHHN